MTLTGGGVELQCKKSIKTSCGEMEVEPLSPGARMFLQPAMNCFILAVAGCKTAIDVGVVKQGLNQTLINHPRFSSKPVVDAQKGNKRVWVRTQVNLDDHVIVPNLDPNMDSPDEFLENYLSNMTTIPMDFSKPLWELHLLNIKTSHANAISVLKIHHSLGDGISLISLVLACTRKTSDPTSLPSVPTKKLTNKSKSASPKGRAWRLLLATLFVLKLLWNTILHMIQFFATVVYLKDTDTPLKGSQGTEKNCRRLVHRTVSLDDIKLLKNEMNATINDVMMGLLQAGLSRYLNRKYGARAQGSTDNQNKLPKNIRLRACLLVNIRPSGGIQELADMMEKGSNCEWGNKIGYILLPFHVAMSDDPLHYIRQAKATIDQKKQSLEAKLTYAVALLILRVFGEKAIAALTHRVIRHTTLTFSNVVGPLEDISFYGHPMAYLAPTVYGHPQALTIHFQSHVDKVTIVVAADETIVPDPHQICDDIEESLQQMKNVFAQNEVELEDGPNPTEM